MKREPTLAELRQAALDEYHASDRYQEDLKTGHPAARRDKSAEELRKTLGDVMPQELTGGEYHDTLAYKLRNLRVTKVHDSGLNWPAGHKNICKWVELEDGRAVGWNENVSRGWSFPVLTKNQVLTKKL